MPAGTSPELALGGGASRGAPSLTASRPADEDFCYLTTRGRTSGREHTIEIWFAWDGESVVYLLSGGRDRSDWVKNLQADPSVTLRIGAQMWSGRARLVEAGEEDERARSLVMAKYQPRYGGDLSAWRRRSLPVAVDLAQLEAEGRR
ncbi:MAG: nitroreductase/quinone reductase family protein [Acidimicrobiia bacterium]